MITQGLPSAEDLDAVAEEQRIAAATARRLRYEVWPIELSRSPYRFEVVDLERGAKIIARCAGEETAEHIAKQMNEWARKTSVPNTRKGEKEER